MHRVAHPIRGTAVGLLAAAALAQPAEAGVTAGGVRKAIQAGLEFMRSRQQANGAWASSASGGRNAGGPTALATLAMLTAGLKPDDQAVARGLSYLRAVRPQGTYAVGLMAMVFAMAEPQRDMFRLDELAQWLQDAQIKGGSCAGMWGYVPRASCGDNSNTQYALLGLKEAAGAGVKVAPAVWRRSREHWLSVQNRDGSWGYRGRGGDARASMTVAGVASLLICGSQLHTSLARVLPNGQLQNCGKYEQEAPVASGLVWIARNFSVTNNHPIGRSWLFYYLYGLERAGRISGQRFFGAHDWYREGAEYLVSIQGPGGSWVGSSIERDPVVATSFALLFLAKGRWPVLINSIKWAGDHNRGRKDLRNLTAEISQVWQTPVTWQEARLAGASVDDLLMAPLVYFSGHDAPHLNDDEIKKLREYVLQGGFLMCEANCGRTAFDNGIRPLLKRMFPEPALQLRRLEADHPIWRAEYDLKPTYPLEGIDVGCRTSVVYSPKDLSCYWEQGKQPLTIKQFRLGINICAYATGKENLHDKLEARFRVNRVKSDVVQRGAIELAKLKHGGGWNVATMAVPNLMGYLRENANLNVAPQPRELAVSDPNLKLYPLAFMEGRNRFSFTPDEVRALARYLEGGTLMANALCGSSGFDESFRELMRKIFPKNPLERLPATHALFTNRSGYDIRKVSFSTAMAGMRSDPYLEAVVVDGRLAVIYSKYDLSCALELHPTFGCRGYGVKDAFKIATNIVLYALTQ